MKEGKFLISLFILFFIFSCAGGKKTADDLKDIKEDLPDVQEDVEIEEEEDADLIEKDITPIDGDVIPTDDIKIKDDLKVEEEDVVEKEGEDADIEVSEKDVIEEEKIEEEDVGPQPLCPCNPIENPVCGIDGKDYINDTCGMCAICKNCKNCEGEKECDFEKVNWVAWKGKCDYCPASCTKDEKESGLVCGYVGLGEYEKFKKGEKYKSENYDNLCAMKCADEWKGVLFKKPPQSPPACWNGEDGNPHQWCEYVVNFGECIDEICEPCEGQKKDPVCGTDGKSYVNKCYLYKCPKTPGVKIKCAGACVEGCPDCDNKPCKPVCAKVKVGKDLAHKTFNNKCYAECKGAEIVYEKQCCFECLFEGEDVCGYSEGNPVDPNDDELVTFLSDCPVKLCFPEFDILYEGKCECACTMDGAKVCGVDNETYPNKCWAQCKAGGVMYDGECKECPQCPKKFNPVCGSIGDKQEITFANQCLIECVGATKKKDGVCPTCEDICGTPENPKQPKEEVCGEDGITYPNECFPIKCTEVKIKEKAPCQQ